MEDTIRAAVSAEPETWFVCVLGVSVVFFGLVFLICIVSLMNFITEKLGARHKKAEDTVTPPAVAAPIENKQELIAAVCAAVAEENGTDISAIRVISFRKI